MPCRLFYRIIIAQFDEILSIIKTISGCPNFQRILGSLKNISDLSVIFSFKVELVEEEFQLLCMLLFNYCVHKDL